MKKKLIFFGTPEIAVEIIKGINKHEFELLAVVTQTDKKVGRKQVLTFSAVKNYAIENEIKIFQPNKVKDILEGLKQLNPDLILTCAYGKLLPQSVIDLVNGKAINVHASLLPKYRGSAPIQFSLINGDEFTGISLMQMVQEMDAGDFYVQDKIQITNNDDFGSLYRKLAKLGRDMIFKYLNDIYLDKIKPIKQEPNFVSFAPKILSSMEKINFNESNIKIVNLIRALSPFPGAYAIINGSRYKIFKARKLREDEFFPMTLNFKRTGEIIFMDKEGFVVYSWRSMFKVLEIQKEGKNKVSAGSYFNNSNADIKIGAIFNEDETKFDY
ncbi:methionyl-tRNA formyltransferase [Spiroplasma endosymbiont of Panorpa germanica]|uniref:methionyl-tRNA formyltransferase n=1 Tax=Spiroplasma endosymbiont of Panorpa germanica TaxID=3066314 RepID=UPI0030CF109F